MGRQELQDCSTHKDSVPVFPILVLLLLTSLLLFQRRIMAETHEDEDTVIEEEYKV